MDKTALDEKVQLLAADICGKNDLELVRAEVIGSGRQKTVRIFIDKPTGVTHEDCSLVSRQVGDQLDALDLIDSEYILEVSSPGLERELYSLKDFQRFAGSLAKLKTKAPLEGQRNFRGRIGSVEGEEIIFEDKTNGNLKIPFAIIKKANLEIDIEEEFKRNDKGKTESGE